MGVLVLTLLLVPSQRTPLHFACEAGSQECVKELLQAGAAANVSDQDARTPLHFGETMKITFTQYTYTRIFSGSLVTKGY